MTGVVAQGRCLVRLAQLEAELANLRDLCREHTARWDHATERAQDLAGTRLGAAACAHGQAEALEVAVKRVAAVRQELTGEASRDPAAAALDLAVRAAGVAVEGMGDWGDRRLSVWVRQLGLIAGEIRDRLGDLTQEGGGGA